MSHYYNHNFYQDMYGGSKKDEMKVHEYILKNGLTKAKKKYKKVYRTNPEYFISKTIIQKMITDPEKKQYSKCFSMAKRNGLNNIEAQKQCEKGVRPKNYLKFWKCISLIKIKGMTFSQAKKECNKKKIKMPDNIIKEIVNAHVNDVINEIPPEIKNEVINEVVKEIEINNHLPEKTIPDKMAVIKEIGKNLGHMLGDSILQIKEQYFPSKKEEDLIIDKEIEMQEIIRDTANQLNLSNSDVKKIEIEANKVLKNENVNILEEDKHEAIKEIGKKLGHMLGDSILDIKEKYFPSKKEEKLINDKEKETMEILNEVANELKLSNNDIEKIKKNVYVNSINKIENELPVVPQELPVVQDEYL